MPARAAPVALALSPAKTVNRLRWPECAVVSFHLAAGAVSSKPHLPSWATVPKDPAGVSADFHFAPEKEKIKLTYTLNDKTGAITKASFLLFGRNSDKPLWFRELTAEERQDGPHAVEWDGKVDVGESFPAGFVTVQHSPYKLKLEIESAGRAAPRTAWTHFHVLIHELSLELGPQETLAEGRDRALWTEFKGTGDLKAALPDDKTATPKRITLLSNLFSKGSDKTDNTSFSAYKDLWKTGANLPVLVRPKLRTSDDKAVESPNAVGKVRFLWNYEDVAEDVSGHFTEGKEFVDLAIDYHKATTKPKGDNCHIDRGGKRGTASTDVFPDQTGYAPADALNDKAFPFLVKGGTKRTWAAYSESWPKGKLAGLSGVMLQPARTAGDTYKLTVCFPHLRTADGLDKLDTEDDAMLEHAVRASTGPLQVWREVRIVKYRKKKATIPDINLGAVADYFSKSYLAMVDKTGGTREDFPDYDTKLRAQVTDWWKKLALATGDQGTITDSAAKFLSYADWKAAVKAEKTWTDAQLATFLSGKSLNTEPRYKDFLEAICDKSVIATLGDYFAADDGINLFQFDLYWEADGGLKSGTNGFASTDFSKTSRTVAGYLQTRVNYGVGSSNNMQQTTTHEIGHILFLPHAHSAAGFSEALHDERSHWNNCTMSYNYDQERKFCGLCLLRLRGWDGTKLDKDRTKNKKP